MVNEAEILKLAGQAFSDPRTVRRAYRGDAVNGAVMTLLAAGNVRAAQDGKGLSGPKELQPNQIGRTTFYKEDEPPAVGQAILQRKAGWVDVA